MTVYLRFTESCYMLFLWRSPVDKFSWILYQHSYQWKIPTITVISDLHLRHHPPWGHWRNRGCFHGSYFAWTKFWFDGMKRIIPPRDRKSWWRHQMETFSALLAICAGNSPVTGEFPTQRLVTRSFDVFFDLRLDKRLSKQSWGRWFETPSLSLWRHCNVCNGLANAELYVLRLKSPQYAGLSFGILFLHAFTFKWFHH